VTVAVLTEAFELFTGTLAQMPNGNAVSIIRVHAALTSRVVRDSGGERLKC
jgi:hypothetical protein